MHNPVLTYEMFNEKNAHQNFFPKYATSCIVGNRLYAGDINLDGVRYSDRMLRSSIGKFDTFNREDFIDVEIADGDEIVRLIGLDSKILQFKKNSLYLIETSGGIERLADKKIGFGIHNYYSVIKAEGVIIWANENGCFIFDGKKYTNLIEGKIDSIQWRKHFGFNIDENGDVNNSGFPELAYDPHSKVVIVEYNPFDTKDLVHNEGYSEEAISGDVEFAYHYKIANQSWFLVSSCKSIDLNTGTDSFWYNGAIESGVHRFFNSNFITQQDYEISSINALSNATGYTEESSEFPRVSPDDVRDEKPINPESQGDTVMLLPSVFRIFGNTLSHGRGNGYLNGYIDDTDWTFLNIYKYSRLYYEDKGINVHSSDPSLDYYTTSIGGEIAIYTKDFHFGQPGVRKKLNNLYLTYRIHKAGTGDSTWLIKAAVNGSGEFVETVGTIQYSDDTQVYKWVNNKFSISSLHNHTSGAEPAPIIYSVQFKIYKTDPTLDTELIDIMDMSISFRRKGAR